MIKGPSVTKHFEFNLSQILFKSEEKKNRDLGTYQEFINALKIYFVNELDSNSIDPLHKRFNAYKRVIGFTKYFNPTSNSDDAIKGRKRYSQMNLQLLQTCLEILDFYPLPDTLDLQEEYQLTFQEIREQMTINDRNRGLQQRQLAEFQSLFYFDKLIDYFWQYEAGRDEKLLYYPIYLWWKITSILPLRPTEFLLTPNDCLSKNQNGEFLLRVRRSNVKGATKLISHKLEVDYSIHEYIISNNLAFKIKEYLELTKKLRTPSQFLLSKYAYAATLGTENYIKQEMFGLANLDLLLKRFFIKIIQDKLGIRLYYKSSKESKGNEQRFKDQDKFLEPNEIMMINLGDTRHIAMVSLVLNDFNPIIIRDFAGHDDINTSFHYFNHVGKIVKCMSYYKYQEIKNKSLDNIEVSNLINNRVNLSSIAKGIKLTKRDEYLEVERGFCYSKRFSNGDLSDCITNGNDDECEGCDFFIPNKLEGHRKWIKTRRDEIEKRLDEEGMFLAKILTTYANTYNEYEEFQRRMIKIQHDAKKYFNLTNKLGDDCE